MYAEHMSFGCPLVVSQRGRAVSVRSLSIIAGVMCFVGPRRELPRMRMPIRV